MKRSDHWIGFDRRIESSWLDVAASKVAMGASEEEVRQELLTFLKSLSHDPEESGSARSKTIRVILRIWGGPDQKLVPFHESCAQLFEPATSLERLALHWAMTLAAYPYFFAHAATIGSLLKLQETVSAQQVRRRIQIRWGERSTVKRTSRHVVRTMVAWDVLEESNKGTYTTNGTPSLVSPAIATKLIHAVLFNATGNAMPVDQLVGHAALFPFDLAGVDLAEIRQSEEVQIFHEGGGTTMARLRDRPPDN